MERIFTFGILQIHEYYEDELMILIPVFFEGNSQNIQHNFSSILEVIHFSGWFLSFILCNFPKLWFGSELSR